MTTHRVLFASLLAAAFAGMPAMASAEPATVSTIVTPTQATAPDPTPVDDAARYAEQEKQSPAAADFEGGRASIYIGGSALGIVLLVVLLVILL